MSIDILPLLYFTPTLVVLWFLALWAYDRLREKRDEKAMARRYRNAVTRPMSDAEKEAAEAWLQARRTKRGSRP